MIFVMRLLGLIGGGKKSSVGKVSVKRCCHSISQDYQCFAALEVKKATMFVCFFPNLVFLC